MRLRNLLLAGSMMLFMPVLALAEPEAAKVSCSATIVSVIQSAIKSVDKPSAEKLAARTELSPELQSILQDISKRKDFEKKLEEIQGYKAKVERRKGYNDDWEPQAIADARHKLEVADMHMARGHVGAVYDMFSENFQTVVRNTYEIGHAKELIKQLQEGAHRPEEMPYVNQQIKELQEDIVLWKEGVGEEIDGFRFILGHLRTAVETQNFVDTNDTYMKYAALESMPVGKHVSVKPQDSARTRYLDSANKLFKMLGINADGDNVTFTANKTTVTLPEINVVANSTDAQVGRWREMARTELAAAVGSWSLSVLRSFSFLIDKLPAKIATPAKKALGLFNATLLKKLYSKKINDIVTAPLDKKTLIEMMETYAGQSSNDEFFVAFLSRPNARQLERWVRIRRFAKQFVTKVQSKKPEDVMPIERLQAQLYDRMIAAEKIAEKNGFQVEKPPIAATITYGTPVVMGGVYLYTHPTAWHALMQPIEAIQPAVHGVLQMLPSLPF